jgi:folate-binding protein YgfZ
MNADWSAQMPRDFGDPAGELIAARDATVVAPLVHLALIECVGPDAGAFLHNQLTSDVKRLAAAEAQYAAWCSPMGRMLASFMLFRRDADYLALLPGDQREFILKRLQIYVLRSRLVLKDRSADHAIIGVSGPQAEAALYNAGLQAPSVALTTSNFSDGSVVRLNEARYLVTVASGAAARIWRALSEIAIPVGVPAWQWLDLAEGILWVTEATREAFVPQMAGFDRMGGVSFNKGCYPGQEVVARTRYLGKLKRHLYRVHADGPVASGAAIFSAAAPGTSCGQIASAAATPDGGHDALAVILDEAVNQELWATLPDAGRIGLTRPDPVFL